MAVFTPSTDDYSEAIKQATEAATLYMDDVDSWQEDGYGPARCFHGTNLWTEYDPICGPCEDGQFDPRRDDLDGPAFEELVEQYADSICRVRHWTLIQSRIRDTVAGSKPISYQDMVSLKTLADLALNI